MVHLKSMASRCWLLVVLASLLSCDKSEVSDVQRPRDPGDRGEPIFADPPSGRLIDPNESRLITAPALDANLKGAERLYQLGLSKTTPTNPNAGYWEFAECTAFNPDYALCHRAVAVIASRRGQRDEAIKEFEVYLRLDPAAADVSEVRALVADLRAGKDYSGPEHVKPECDSDEAVVIVTTTHLDCEVIAQPVDSEDKFEKPMPARFCLPAGTVVLVVKCGDGATVRALTEVVAGIGQIVELKPEPLR